MPHAPSPAKEVISHGPTGELDGRFQAAHPGSYGRVDAWGQQPLLGRADGLEISFYAQPWMLSSQYPQSIISTLNAQTQHGFSILLDQENNLALWVATEAGVETIKVAFEARKERWFRAGIRIRNTSVEITISHIAHGAEITPLSASVQTKLRGVPRLDSEGPLLFGAMFATSPKTTSAKPIHFFNGRLDSPHFKALAHRDWDIAKYDFSVGIDTDEIFDVSGSGLSGILVNSPTRAIRGYDYDHHLIGYSWKDATYGFGAIHFHDDDLDDADWETDLRFTVPLNIRSGAYAVEVSDAEDPKLVDAVVFFVRPKTIRRQAKVAFVFSTFTYLAYANEHMYDETKSTHISFPEGVQPLVSDNYFKMLRRTDLGMAIYDLHSDLSPVVYSSSKRPILNVRPDYVHWAFERPREFAADLLMVGFLEKLLGAEGYDTLTDHDLHLRGAAALASYDVVIAGAHPEYPTMESLDAYETFSRRGGSLLYTGGNGFYVSSP